MRVLISLTLTLLAIGSISCIDCPSGWKCLGEKCYCTGELKTNYWSRETVQEACEFVGATLVMPKSQEENDFIANLMPSSSVIFFGLERQTDDELQWHDFDVITSTSYTNFDEGSGPSDGECSIMQKTQDKTFWSHVYCDVDVNYNICQAPVSCTKEFSYVVDQECLFYEANPKTFSNARTACQEAATGGDMASQTSETVVNKVRELANTLNTKIWIGVTDSATEGTWVWTSTGQVANIDWWDNGQPDNWKGNEDCAVVRPNQMLNDRNCAAVENYVCSAPYVVKRFFS